MDPCQKASKKSLIFLNIFEYKESDYQYRIYITELELRSIMLYCCTQLDYTNFKDSVKDWDLYTMYNRIWSLGKTILGKK